MPFLTVDRLAKAYKKHEVIKDLSFAVEPLETLVIFGPSGAGKTVLLRLIAGMIHPDRGTITAGGRDITDLNPEQRHLGMAFQNFALYPHMTAYENIASPLRAKQTTKAELDARVHEVATLLRIDHVLSHLPRALSNGQKQRTALARSLVSRPPLILLDDPLRNVDAKVRYEMRLELPARPASARNDRRLRHPGLQGGDGARRSHRRARRWGNGTDRHPTGNL